MLCRGVVARSRPTAIHSAMWSWSARGWHEQSGSKGWSPLSTRTDHQPAFDTGFLGEQVTTATRERPQLGHGLVDRAACRREPHRGTGRTGRKDAVGAGLRTTGGHPPVSNRLFELGHLRRRASVDARC
jgi:hypothetical protein